MVPCLWNAFFCLHYARIEVHALFGWHRPWRRCKRRESWCFCTTWQPVTPAPAMLPTPLSRLDSPLTLCREDDRFACLSVIEAVCVWKSDMFVCQWVTSLSIKWSKGGWSVLVVVFFLIKGWQACLFFHQRRKIWPSKVRSSASPSKGGTSACLSVIYRPIASSSLSVQTTLSVKVGLHIPSPPPPNPTTHPSLILPQKGHKCLSTNCHLWYL